MTKFDPSVVAQIDQATGQSLYDGARQDVMNKLASNGHVAPRYPYFPVQDQFGVVTNMKYSGDIPEDLTKLTDDQLGYYLGKLSEWMGYVSYDLALARTARDSFQAKLDLIDAQISIRNKTGENGKKLSNPERQALIIVNPERVKIHSETLYWEAYYIIVKVIFDKAERNWQSVSRRVTQRGQDIERMHRTQGAQNHLPVQTPYFKGPHQ